MLYKIAMKMTKRVVNITSFHLSVIFLLSNNYTIPLTFNNISLVICLKIPYTDYFKYILR